MNDKNNIAHN